MNPIRALFLSLSKMPPAAILLIVIGMAVVVTMQVTGSVSKRERERERQAVGDQQSASITPNTKTKQVVYSLTYIPAGSKIESKQITLRAMDELDVFDDAEDSLSSVIGVVPQKSIPSHAQIRRMDLNPILH